VPPAPELEGFVDKLLKTFFGWLHPILPPDIAYDTVVPHRLTSNFKTLCQLPHTDSVASIQEARTSLQLSARYRTLFAWFLA
jgi:hypothetical protein